MRGSYWWDLGRFAIGQVKEKGRMSDESDLGVYPSLPFQYKSRYEMRVNMKTGLASQRKLSAPAVEFPHINQQYTDSHKVSSLSARVDSLNVEAGRIDRRHSHSKARTLSLAFKSIGVIYGDIGTLPLYMFSSTFTDGIKHNDDILGVLSLIIYTIILLPMIKYIFIVLWANDNGDGEFLLLQI
ncbi:hypothetical protein Droror1_Dr00019366 [Drosera rotundifolia]